MQKIGQGGRRHHEDCTCAVCSETYVQCRLIKTEGSSRMERVTWADSQKAIQGRTVKVEENDGSWTQDWLVADVYGQPLPKRLVIHRSHDYTRQRIASDI